MFAWRLPRILLCVAEVHAAARASYLRDVQSVAELDARAKALHSAYVPEKLANSSSGCGFVARTFPPSAMDANE
jgi:hypothetical protein